MKKVSVIGSGFASLSSAAVLAQAGFDVTVYEKNATPGGRARKFETQGFTFDMGPSWYWMPDVFDKYFARFGKTSQDFYQLQRLDPSYRIYFGKGTSMDVPAGIPALFDMFEKIETGSGKQLKRFLDEGRYKYEIGINNLVYNPGQSLRELLDPALLSGIFKLHVFRSLSTYIRKFFKDPRLIQLLEFPVLFLGATPGNTPALYSLMNYADMALGTWYPMGGMYKVVEAMTDVARQQGVQFQFNSAVTRLDMNGVKSNGIWVDNNFFPSNYIVAGADYHHVEQQLIPQAHRRYNETYWDNRVLAPSSLIFYLGLNKKVKGLLHHTLFFDEDFGLHAREIYDNPRWPTAPQFYVSCPSKTDPSVAPAEHENIMILIPVAPGLTDDEATREKYFDLVMNRLENIISEKLREHIVFKRSYAHRDFVSDYHAYKGNAYGLANTLKQTAHLKPTMINKKINNLFYTGQLTVPGPGVPPALISGQVAAQQLIKRYQEHENH